MLEMPKRARRPHARGGSHNPLSFFAISNLYTIEECSRNSDGMPESTRADIDSLSEAITALPPWEEIQAPRPAITRHDSRDRILEKCFFTSETDLSSDGSGASQHEDEENGGPSRLVLWLIIVVIILMAIAIILGAVLGTFAHPKSQNAPDPSITEIPADTSPIPTPTGGRDKPRPPEPTSSTDIPALAVTGWSEPGDSGYYTTWLFSQDDRGNLSRHTFNSSTGNWTRVSNFAVAKLGTPIAATAMKTDYYIGLPSYNFPRAQYQVSVVYLDENNYLTEWNFPDSSPAIGQPGSLTQQKYIVHNDTNISFYWPSLIYQGMSGEIREAHFECHRRNECWHDKVLRTTEARNGTQLAMVPMQNSLASTGLFYQEENGRYVNYKEDFGEGTTVWENEAFSNLIPRNASISVFATPRPNSNTALNTYLIWQNATGISQMSWTDTDEGWKGPVTPAAFAGANNNTALACLTGLTYPGFPLPEGNELSRCWFQAGLAVREVWFDGDEWKAVGNVPTFGF